nr:hypothetical protein [Tanacetum cinerariifolium]
MDIKGQQLKLTVPQASSPTFSRKSYKQKTNIGDGNPARCGGSSSLTSNGNKRVHLLEVFEVPQVMEVQRVLPSLVDQEDLLGRMDDEGSKLSYR